MNSFGFFSHVIFFFFFCHFPFFPVSLFVTAVAANKISGGQCEYRRALPPSFLFKFFVEVSIKLEGLYAAVGSSDASLPPPPVIGRTDRWDCVERGGGKAL